LSLCVYVKLRTQETKENMYMCKCNYSSAGTRAERENSFIR